LAEKFYDSLSDLDGYRAAGKAGLLKDIDLLAKRANAMADQYGGRYSDEHLELTRAITRARASLEGVPGRKTLREAWQSVRDAMITWTDAGFLRSGIDPEVEEALRTRIDYHNTSLQAQQVLHVVTGALSFLIGFPAALA